MIDVLQQRIDNYLEQLKNVTELHKVVDVENCTIFLMKNQNSMMCSVYIAFLPQGIISIYGDFAPCKNGVMSDRGKSIDWFLRATEPGYLGEKFLTQEWHWQNTVDQATCNLEHRKDMDDKEKAFWTDLSKFDVCSSVTGILDAVEEHEQDIDETPGHGYNPYHLPQLVSIQRKFTELYKV